ncbi:hypothetical protein CPC08DRAFT_635558, partial [Agrocybe pediades]
LDSAGTNDPADPIDPSHKGPILAYMAKVNNATQSTVTGLNWFKIYHDGLDGTTWAVDKLIANQGKVSFTIPSCIPPGQYLLRVELIALHGAETYPGAQLYMECAQIQVTGGGSASPSTVSFPGAYKGSDPGITVNIYNNLKSYTIPGPSVFSCNGNSSPSSPSTTVANPSPTTVSSSAPASSSSSTGSAAGSVAHYGQCGGLTYSGPTTCAAPYSCVKSSDYVCPNHPSTLLI